MQIFLVVFLISTEDLQSQLSKKQKEVFLSCLDAVNLYISFIKSQT